jgi:hypothetical protein
MTIKWAVIVYYLEESLQYLPLMFLSTKQPDCLSLLNKFFHKTEFFVRSFQGLLLLIQWEISLALIFKN